MIKICIDAGHYGYYNKSTVVSPTYWESIMSWKLHLLLKQELEKFEGVTVITTRKEQAVDLGVYERGLKAKGCNLFLSLHSNYCDTPSVDRAEVIYPVSGKCKDLSEKLVACIASCMKTNDKTKIFSKWNSSKNADYYGVIRGAAAVGVPGLILEHSFHSNARAAKWLQSDDNLLLLAKAEANVIAEYYGLKSKEEIDMKVEEVKKMIDASVSDASKKLLSEVKKSIEEAISASSGKWIQSIDDIPHESVKEEMRTLLDEEVVNGGTPFDENPNDILLPYNMVRVLVMAMRYANLLHKEK